MPDEPLTPTRPGNGVHFHEDGTMTNEQRKRVLSAMTETCRQLEKAESYMPKFQDKNYIESLKAHIAKLEAMLAS
jgi:hypothetical protein